MTQFTGKERDAGGEDYFGARYFAFRTGRFLTPDWSGSPQLVPFAKLDSPQSLNLYAYVQNNPITGTDPDGHLAVYQYNYIGLRLCSANAACDSNFGNWSYHEYPRLQKNKTQKPLTAAQIQRTFYKHYGKLFNQVLKQKFGKDFPGTQTLANAPKLDTTKTRQELKDMKGNTEFHLDGFNHPDAGALPATRAMAQNGTVYISSELVASRSMNDIFGTLAHETANLLDFEVNALTKPIERHYGDKNLRDKDTGANVEHTMFPDNEID
jgi:RHS repeat-associated protein